jgi:hypothetical protein
MGVRAGSYPIFPDPISFLAQFSSVWDSCRTSQFSSVSKSAMSKYAFNGLNAAMSNPTIATPHCAFNVSFPNSNVTLRGNFGDRDLRVCNVVYSTVLASLSVKCIMSVAIDNEISIETARTKEFPQTSETIFRRSLVQVIRRKNIQRIKIHPILPKIQRHIHIHEPPNLKPQLLGSGVLVSSLYDHGGGGPPSLPGDRLA